MEYLPLMASRPQTPLADDNLYTKQVRLTLEHVYKELLQEKLRIKALSHSLPVSPPIYFYTKASFRLSCHFSCTFRKKHRSSHINSHTTGMHLKKFQYGGIIRTRLQTVLSCGLSSWMRFSGEYCWQHCALFHGISRIKRMLLASSPRSSSRI